MNTQLTTKPATAITTPQEAWGTEATSSKDLVVPRLQLAQATSDAVKGGDARPGQILNSQTKAVMAEKGAFLELLPILTVGSWVVMEPIIGAQPKFMRMEALTPGNDSESWKFEGHENGKPVLKQKRLSVLVLPTNALDGFPFFVDFQKTGRTAGQVLSTILQENRFKGLPAPARVVKLGASLKTRDTNTWFAFSVAVSRDATALEIDACKRWYDTFKGRATEAALEQKPSEEIPF